MPSTASSSSETREDNKFKTQADIVSEEVAVSMYSQCRPSIDEFYRKTRKTVKPRTKKVEKMMKRDKGDMEVEACEGIARGLIVA